MQYPSPAIRLQIVCCNVTLHQRSDGQRLLAMLPAVAVCLQCAVILTSAVGQL